MLRNLEKGILSALSQLFSWISEGQGRKCGTERKALLGWMRAKERRRDIIGEPEGFA